MEFQSPTLWSATKAILPSLIGSGLGATLISIIFKRKFDKDLELQKAALQRGTMLHEHQVEILSKIYKLLVEIQELTIYLSSLNHHEAVPDSSLNQLWSAIRDAKSEYLAMHLYLPQTISEQVDDFFNKVYECTSLISRNAHGFISTEQERQEALSNSHRIATLKIPTLLKTIEIQARKIIHGLENG